jgi:Ca2+-transporting ATPase
MKWNLTLLIFFLFISITHAVSFRNFRIPLLSNKRKIVRSSLRSFGGGSITATSIANRKHFSLSSPPHTLKASDILNSLQSSEITGLTTEEAKNRLLIYGENKLQEKPPISLLALFFEQFEDNLVRILVVVALFSASSAIYQKDLSSAIESSVIIGILILNAFIGIFQTKSAENSLNTLKKLQPELCTVLRNGHWIHDYSSSQLVPGDILQLRVGDRIPADCRILSLKTNTFEVDEASLTGESCSVSKNNDFIADSTISISAKLNMLFAGTIVTSGTCYAIVTSTGQNSEIGKINSAVLQAKEETASEKTPLILKLNEFSNQLGKIIIGICLFSWILSIPKFNNSLFSSRFAGALYYMKTAIALGVAAIPEGLPTIITLCLSLGAKRMAKKNVIVRKLSSIETLGCTTTICTDKTGTLTTNKMTVTSLFTFPSLPSVNSESVSYQERPVSGVSYQPIGQIENYSFNETAKRLPVFQKIAAISALCNEAEIQYTNGTYEVIGEPTEGALKVLVEKLGVQGINQVEDPQEMILQFSRFWFLKYNRKSIFEFNRKRKSMSVLVQTAAKEEFDLHDSLESSSVFNENMKNHLFVKGAPDMLIERCSKLMLEDGTTIPITTALRHKLLEEFKIISKRPLRCLAFAYKSEEEEESTSGGTSSLHDKVLLKMKKDQDSYVQLESNLTLVGFVGIKDPPRLEIASSIQRCKQAGIRIIMITGDSKETAVAIAKDVGILSSSDNLLECSFTGREFLAFNESQQLIILKTGNKVFSRTEPLDKQRIITRLKQLNEITAMTGDGVNDAPALQQASIGIAMGITGTAVAKSVADLILTDDNFSSIVEAVEEGRNIYSHMQSFIFFLLSCNMGEIIAIFLANLLSLPDPLSPLHLLWVNIITDGCPASALAFNPTDPNNMKKPPRKHNEPLFTKKMMIRYLLSGSYVGIATVVSFIWWFLDQKVPLKQLLFHRDPASFLHSVAGIKSFEKPQSLALSVLIGIEMIKALCAVSNEASILEIPPWKNRWLLPAVVIPSLLHLFIMYTPSLANIFHISPLSGKEWKVKLSVVSFLFLPFFVFRSF